MDQFLWVKIEIFIPCEFVEAMRVALSEVNIGRIGNYDQCVAVSQVTGYWRPLEGASPYEGEIGKVHSAPECKIEVTALRDYASQALEVIKRVHPYEEPVINIIPLVNHLF